MSAARLRRVTWRHVAGASIAALVAAAVVRGVAAEWQALPPNTLSQFHLAPGPLALAWSVQTAGWLLVVDTWQRIVSRLGGQARFVTHLRVYSFSNLAYVLPGSIWVPVGRVALYSRSGIPVVVSGAAVAVEWLLLGVAGLVLYGLAAPFSRAVPPSWAPLIVLLGVLSVVLLVPSVFGRLVAAAARAMRSGAVPPGLAGRDIVGWFMRELAVLSLSGVALYLFMLGTAPDASPPDAMAAAAWMMAVSNLLALLPTTAIVKDGGMVLMLGPMFGSTVIALGVAVAWRVWLALTGLSWAALAAAAGRWHAKEAEPPSRVKGG